jgi:ParB family transcriptional regulator, chromosome partitioning protein
VPAPWLTKPSPKRFSIVASPKKGGLGRGLGALIPGSTRDEAEPAVQKAPPQQHPAVEMPSTMGERLVHLDPSTIESNPQQPRRVFREEALEELAASIKQDGVQEPVLVRQVEGRYELVSGERRVRASIMADVSPIPAIVRDVSDRDMLKLGLIENIQREDLNSIETAQAYDKLIAEFGWTQEELAAEVGKKRATVTNTLRLLNLPQDVQDAVGEGQISMGHARALLALSNAHSQSLLCKKIVKEGLSVRQVEQLTSKTGNAGGSKGGTATPAVLDPNLQMVETNLRRRLGTKVSLRPSGENKGKIEIEYYNLEDLERIIDSLGGRH